MALKQCLWGTMAAVAAAGLVGSPPLLAQNNEWEESSTFYEDDAWYDMSEWFDSNDYNPTDEEVGIINNEQYDEYHSDSDLDSDYVYDYDYDYDTDYDYGDVYDYDDDYDAGYDYDYGIDYGDAGLGWDDRDYGWSWYGYDDYYDNDWFYDWYDDGYASWYDWNDDGTYDSKYRYFDYDEDGLYDAVLTQFDYDDDGFYDESNYETFSDTVTTSQRQQSQQAGDQSSRPRRIQGTVEQMKTVSLPNSKNLVVAISPQQGDRVMVDLGPKERLQSLDVQNGDQLRAKGPVTKIGNQRVLMAQSVSANDQQKQIDRTTRQTQGTIASTREIESRRKTHLIAMLKKDGKKLAVDLGNADAARQFGLQEGGQVTVFGPRVKVEDRPILIAQKIKRDGQTHSIQRMKQTSDSQRDRRSQSQQASRSRQRGQQQTDRQQADRQQRDRQRPQDPAQRNRRARLSGEVAALRKVTVRDSRRQIAEVETDQGQTIVIDLGPAKQFQADLQEGDQLQAEGALTRSGETTVLIARKVMANDQTFQVPSSDQQRRQRRERTISGEIVNLRNVTVRNREHRLAMIETQDGSKIAVDLGRRNRLDADLQKGDKITAEGVLVRSGDRQTLVATDVTHDGRSVTVLRPSLEDESDQQSSSSDKNRSQDESNRNN